MRLMRFILVLLLLTVLGVTLGTASGALLGAAVPGQVTVHGESSSDARGPEASEGEVMLAHESDRSPVQSGAALGAGFGLMAGVGAGLVLGVLDQLLLAWRETSKRKQESAAHG